MVQKNKVTHFFFYAMPRKQMELFIISAFSALFSYALVKGPQSVVRCLWFPRTAQLGAVKFQIPLPTLSPFLTWLLLALRYFSPPFLHATRNKYDWWIWWPLFLIQLLSFFAPKMSETQQEHKTLLTEARVCDVFAKDIWPIVTSKPSTCQNGIFFQKKLADLTWIPCNC